MIKKVLLPLLSIAVLTVGVVFAVSFQHKDKEKTQDSTPAKQTSMPVVESQGLYETFDTAESMQKEADLIVIASPKKTFEQRKHVTTYLKGPNNERYPETTVTLTDVSIKKVLSSKKVSDKKLKSVTVIEYVGIFKDNDGVDKKLRFEGYEEMSEKQDYILYLQKNDKGNYNIVNIINGKFELKSQSKATKQSAIQQEHEAEHNYFNQQVKTKFKKELAEYTN